MKSDAVLINIARGPIVDEVPFWAALQGEKIGLGSGNFCGCKGVQRLFKTFGIYMYSHGLWCFLWDLTRIFIQVL